MNIKGGLMEKKERRVSKKTKRRSGQTRRTGGVLGYKGHERRNGWDRRKEEERRTKEKD